MCFITIILIAPNLLMAEIEKPEATLLVDTYIASGKPSESFADKNGLYVGYWDSSDRDTRRTLLQFSISDPQLLESTTKITITSATLTLHVLNAPIGDSPLEVKARRVIGKWGTDISWESLYTSAPPNVSSEISDGVAVNATKLEQHALDLILLLQSWVDDPARGDAFSILLYALTDEDPSNRFRAFISQDCQTAECQGRAPSLTFEYEVEPTPTPTHTPTVTPTPTSTPIPTPTSTPTSVQVIVDAEWQRSPDSPEPAETPQFYPRDTIFVTLKAQNGPDDLKEVVLTGKIPSDFKVVDESISVGGVSIDNANPPEIRWGPVDSLNAGAKLTETYVLERLSAEVEPIVLEPADTNAHKINTKITFTVENPPDESDYCYQWNLADDGDNKIASYQLKNMPSLQYVYTTAGTYSVQVMITNSNDYYAFVEKVITINDDVGTTDMQEAPSGETCNINAKQDILIKAEVKGVRVDDDNNINVANSASVLVAPSILYYVPLIDN